MKSILVLLSVVFFNVQVAAKTVEGINFAEKLKINDKELVLNGIGIRKATWFKVKVYVGALYLTQKTTNVDKILGQANPKYLEMNFVYNVDKEKLVSGWNEGFKAALSKEALTESTKAIGEFNALMRDVKKGQKIKLEFLDEGVNVSVNNSPYNLVKSKTFAKNLLSIWFINPRDTELANGLRGETLIAKLFY